MDWEVELDRPPRLESGEQSGSRGSDNRCICNPFHVMGYTPPDPVCHAPGRKGCTPGPVLANVAWSSYPAPEFFRTALAVGPRDERAVVGEGGSAHTHQRQRRIASGYVLR